MSNDGDCAVDRFSGIFDRRVYPDGYLDRLREEWERKPPRGTDAPLTPPPPPHAPRGGAASA